MGVTDEQIAALDNGDTSACCFTDEQKAAFAFSDEVMDLIEVTDRTYQTAKQQPTGPSGLIIFQITPIKGSA